MDGEGGLKELFAKETKPVFGPRGGADQCPCSVINLDNPAVHFWYSEFIIGAGVMALMWMFPDSRRSATRRLLRAKSAPQPRIPLKLSHTTIVPRDLAVALGLRVHAFLLFRRVISDDQRSRGSWERLAPVQQASMLLCAERSKAVLQHKLRG